MILGASLFSCKRDSEVKNVSKYQAMILAQIDQTCARKNTQYLKVVYPFDAPEATKEDSIFTLISPASSDESETCILSKELVYGLKYFFDDPFQKEYYTIAQKGDTIVAQVKDEYRESNPMKVQKLVLNQDKTSVSYLETKVSTKTWLYQIDKNIAIMFDEHGIYQSHSLQVSHEVPWITSTFNGIIEGKIRKL